MKQSEKVVVYIKVKDNNKKEIKRQREKIKDYCISKKERNYINYY